MKVSAELTLEIDRLRANAQAAEAHLKRVGVVGATMSAGLDRSMAGVGRGLGRNIDTNRLRGLSAQLTSSNEHVAKFGAGLGAAALAPALDRPLQGLRTLSGAAIGASTVLGGALVASSIKAASSLQDTELQISRFSGSLALAQKLMGEGVELSLKTPFETDTINELTSGLLAAGVAASSVMEDVRRLAAVAEDDQALRELGDVFGKGFANKKFDTERTNQFLDRRINLLPALQDVTGLGLDDLRKAIEQGKIGVDEIRKALDQLRGPGGQFFGMMEARSRTLPGLWSTFASGVKEVQKELGKDSIGPLSDGLTTIINDLMPRFIADSKEAGHSMAGAFEFGVAGLQEMTSASADWKGFWADFESEAQRAINAVGDSLAGGIKTVVKPEPDKAALAKNAQDEAWWIEKVNLGWLKNVELPAARAIDMEGAIDWKGRTGQPWKPGGSVEFVQGEIAREEAKLAAARAEYAALQPPVDLRALKELQASPGPFVTAPGNRTWMPEKGDFHAPGYKPGSDTETLAKINALADANISRRDAKRVAEMALPRSYVPTPTGFGSDADERPSGQGDGGSALSRGDAGRYFAPGVMAAAINRITRQSTNELIYMNAEKQTAELERIARLLGQIDSKMDAPQTITQTPPGRFSTR